MTKKTKYSLEDFYSKTKQQAGAKMPLKIGDEDTGHYLLVKGLSSRCIAQEKTDWQVAYARLVDESEKMADKIDRNVYVAKEKKNLNDKLAILLVSGWSFSEGCTEADKAKLFDENDDLSELVIAFAADSDSYLVKK
tara:strand:- start:1470 stop:1880 length:411 start_codon:yes stop_codon:yes gene_type:complete